MSATTAAFFRNVADALDQAEAHPHGPPCDQETVRVAGPACVSLCDGDQDRGRALWRLIVSDCGGYMPQAAAVALIRASNPTNLAPDVTAPEVS